MQQGDCGSVGRASSCDTGSVGGVNTAFKGEHMSVEMCSATGRECDGEVQTVEPTEHHCYWGIFLKCPLASHWFENFYFTKKDTRKIFEWFLFTRICGNMQEY